jgi:hypothetical protein
MIGGQLEATCYFVNGVLVSWISNKQKVVSLWSSDVEFYALAEAMKETPFITQVLNFLGVPVETPVTVCVETIGLIFMSENLSSSSRTDHMDARWLYVNDLQHEKVTAMKCVGSEENLAVVATKNVPVQVHEQHINKITTQQSYIDG